MRYPVPAIAFLLLIVPACSDADEGANDPIRVSRETTFITGPLHADGTPDYAQYLMDRANEGVTDDNNIATVIIPLIDTEDVNEPLGGRLRARWPIDVNHRFRSAIDFFDYDEHTAWERDEEMLASVGGLPEDLPLTVRWIEANANALNRVHSVIGRERYALPLYSPDSIPLIAATDSVGVLARYRDLIEALCIRAHLRANAGQFDDAARDWNAAYALGRGIERDAHSLLEQLVGIAMIRVAIDSVTTRVTLTPRSAEEIETVAALVSRWKPTPMSVTPCGVHERCLTLDFAMRLRTDAVAMHDALYSEWYKQLGDSAYAATYPRQLVDKRLRSGYFQGVDWNAVLALINANYDRLEQGWTEPDIARVKRQLAEGAAQSAAASARLGDESADTSRAQWVHDYMNVPAYDMLSEYTPLRSRVLYEATRTRLVLLRAAIKIELHRHAHGSYPDSLADSLGNDEDDMGIDPMNGEPLRYRRTADGFVLYSVGWNQKDDGGDDSDVPDDGDYVIQVPFPLDDGPVDE